MPRGKSKRRKKKRRDERRRTLQRRLKRRVRKNLPDQKVLVGPPRDGVKMSEVLEQFVEPYMEYAETEDAYRKLLGIAIVAWNVALLPDKERQSDLDDVLVNLPAEVRDDGKKIAEELMERKERHFSHYRRMILDFEIEDAGDKWHLSVISMATPV